MPASGPCATGKRTRKGPLRLCRGGPPNITQKSFLALEFTNFQLFPSFSTT